MTADMSRTWLEAAASLALVALAGLLVLLAGLAIVVVLPTTLLIVAMGYAWASGPAGGIGNWLFLIWFPLAFLAAIYSVVVGLEVMERPSLGGVAKLLGLAVIIFFTFPPFLFPA